MKWWMIGLMILVIAGVGWLGYSVTRPIPGRQVPEIGREHVTLVEVEKTTYNSNPPTSGPHYEIASKPGIYETPQHDGSLIHSLEHGYVIISYNCNVHLNANSKSQITNPKQISNSKFQNKVYAHEEGESSQSAEISVPSEASGSATNETDGCKSLVKNLKELAEKKKLWKLIVVPRPQLDTTIALTAWGYIDKFDEFDAKRVEAFIDFHRDQGPEKTME